MSNLTSLQFFIPEFILSTTAVVLLLLSLIDWQRKDNVASYVAGIGLALAFMYVMRGAEFGSPPLFWGMIVLDKPAVFFKIIFILTALIVTLFSQRSNELSHDQYEYHALIVGLVLGMNLLSQSSHILMIYLSLEFVSLMSYILVGYTRNSVRSSEAALKYVLYGAIASGIFLYGASLYYGETGVLDISGAIVSNPLAGLLMLAGFLYKIAAVPMHAWCPDAYEGAPTPITAFLSVAPKAAGFAVLMRVMASLGPQFGWPTLIAAVSAVTMTFGNLAAIPQMNLKRLLAYSSIAHAGYLLMGVACGTTKGNEAIYFYFIAYLIMNLGAFFVVQIIANNPSPIALSPKGRGEGEGESLDTYKGIGRRGPYGAFLGIAMTIFLLSLTGVPPFIGFIGKFYIFSAVIDAKLYWLAFIGIANSVVSLYYYMRVVKTMFFDAPSDQSAVPLSSKRLTTALAAMAIATVFFGLSWQWLSNITSNLHNI